MNNFHRYDRNEFNGESGVALIAVLVMLTTVSLLVMSMVAYSQLSSFGIRNDTGVLRSRYVAEGAMNRIIWLLAADTHEYNTSDLLNFDYSEYEEERFIADGRPRTLDYYGVNVKYRIENGMGGLSIDNGVRTPITNLTRTRATNEEELSEAITIFNNRYTDYTDTNDMVAQDGMEEEEYQELEEDVKLPRNNRLQFREELWFIPDGIKFFPPDRNGRLSWINPLYMQSGSNRRNNQKPDLFQANYALLTNYANLSHENAMETLQVIKKFKNSTEPPVLADELDALLLGTLRNYFSTTNSNCFRITIENAAGDAASSARMDATFFNPGISNDGGITFYDWLIY